MQPTDQGIAPAAPIRRGQPLGLSTRVALADDAAGALLPDGLQDRARRYVAARRRSGEALLEAVAELAAARAEAAHGTWYIFLQAIGLDDATARAQIRIHEAGQSDPAFAEKIRTGWLNAATARELLAAPPDVRAAILARPTAPTQRQIKAAKREALPVLPPAAPALPTDLAAGAPWAGLPVGMNPTLEAPAASVDSQETPPPAAIVAVAHSASPLPQSADMRAVMAVLDAHPLLHALVIDLRSNDTAAAISAALALASALAGTDLTELADQLDDATYAALAAYRRTRALVQTLESAVGV